MAFLICLDPAWKADSGGGGRGANEKYALHDVDSMAYEYRRSEPWTDVGPALMFMWATTSAHRTGDDRALVRALGFTQSAEFIWEKVDPDEEVAKRLAFDWSIAKDERAPHEAEQDYVEMLHKEGLTRPRCKVGIGQWSFCDHEYLLVCRRDLDVDLPLPIKPRSVIHAPVGEHSAKPEKAWTQVINVISAQVMPSARLVEYNCRRRRPGCSAVGRFGPLGENGPIIFERGDD